MIATATVSPKLWKKRPTPRRHEGDREEDDDQREGGRHHRPARSRRSPPGARMGGASSSSMWRKMVLEHHHRVVDHDRRPQHEAEHGEVVQREAHVAHEGEVETIGWMAMPATSVERQSRMKRSTVKATSAAAEPEVEAHGVRAEALMKRDWSRDTRISTSSGSGASRAPAPLHPVDHRDVLVPTACGRRAGPRSRGFKRASVRGSTTPSSA